MKVFLTGICGFVGSALAAALRDIDPKLELLGLDNLARPGSEENRLALRRLGVRVFHGDMRLASDFEPLPRTDWVIDCAANPSVLAGVVERPGAATSRQLLEHNLFGTVNLLEFARRHRAGVVLLSTSRVYGIEPLAALPVVCAPGGNAFTLPESGARLPAGFSRRGVREEFSTAAPISLYGATKLASEILALEYGASYHLPVWVNRCGVMAGAGQFGKPDQGIVSFWIHSYRARRKLAYIGFGGHGWQVRDALHPRDLAQLVYRQMLVGRGSGQSPVVNVSGGTASAFSLAQLTAWCRARFEFAHEITAQAEPRPLDLPWLVLDAARAESIWEWQPETSFESICEEIARHAEARPDWLDVSSDT